MQRIRSTSLLLSLLLGTSALCGTAVVSRAHAEQLGNVTVGAPAPDFLLTDLEGKTHSLKGFAGKRVVLEWFNSGCPFVQKHYETGNMQKLQKESIESGTVWLTVVSSAPGKQGHATPKEHKELLQKWGAGPSAFLIDESGEVGKRYGAKTTPHMYIVDEKGVLRYKGAIDDKPSTDKKTVEGATNYVRNALDALGKGGEIAKTATEPYGCSVKYQG
jgi:peroxiredoxin